VPTGPSGLRAFRLRTVFDEVDIPWANPVDVNYHEVRGGPCHSHGMFIHPYDHTNMREWGGCLPAS
jgi:hypothetical protein